MRSQFIRFFLGSAVGLAIDLAGFFLLTQAGWQPMLANGASATASITAVYLLVTRYTFSRSADVATYVLFFAWYAMSIVVFSIAIQAISTGLPAEPEIVKLASVPVSFLLNFAFSRFLFKDRRTPE